jgi:hypothetical protein
MERRLQKMWRIPNKVNGMADTKRSSTPPARATPLPEDDETLKKLVDTVCDALIQALQERKAKQVKNHD